MIKTAVIYVSTTGNTQAMAEAIASAIDGADIFEVSEISPDKALTYDKIAFGSPAMGAETLEESVFEPFFADVELGLKGKRVALFGSYDWGDGQWMRDWEDRVRADGALLYDEGLKINCAPDGEGIERCKKFGAGFAAF